MTRLVISWVPFTALLALGAGPQIQSVTFSGEVCQGQTFRKNIGHGLEFVLTPSLDTPDVITGWTIEIPPQGQPSDPECTDFLPVVTPPYRFQNARYLDTQYGTMAQEAVRASPREFSFVLNCSDFKLENERVGRVLWPYTYSNEDVDEALAKLGSSPLGKGTLWIKDYRITPGKKSAAGVDPGAIHWIRFKVEIKFPAGVPKQPRP